MASGLHIALTGIVSVALLISSCGIGDDKTLPPSGGSPGDLLVVMDSALWSGVAGDEVRQCFSSPQEGLPQSEPLFNLISIGSHDFGNIFRVMRNIVIIRNGGREGKAAYTIERDMWARDQALLIINSNGNNQTASLIQNNCTHIRRVFRTEDYRRMSAAFGKVSNGEAARAIRENTGMTPVIPADFRIVTAEQDMVWIRKDMDKNGHQVSLGIIFTRTPYDSVGMLELRSIMERRNKTVTMVEGPVEKSHMATYSEYEPVMTEQATASIQFTELRGLWNMTGAFMGGPFVHYTFVDSSGKYVLDVDGYVFAPKFDKRTFLMEVEAIAVSVIK